MAYIRVTVISNHTCYTTHTQTHTHTHCTYSSHRIAFLQPIHMCMYVCEYTFMNSFNVLPHTPATQASTFISSPELISRGPAQQICMQILLKKLSHCYELLGGQTCRDFHSLFWNLLSLSPMKLSLSVD